MLCCLCVVSLIIVLMCRMHIKNRKFDDISLLITAPAVSAEENMGGVR